MSQAPVAHKLHKEIEEVDVKDLKNPRSVLMLVPEKLREKMIEAIKARPQWFNLDEGELYHTLDEANQRPKPVDDILRMKFWLEYERVQAFNLDHINFAYITSGVTTRQYFQEFYLRTPSRVAWLLTPPINYAARIDEVHFQAMMSLSEIVRMPVIDSHGKRDLKLAELKLKIFQAMDIRKNGAVVQRIDQTNKNLNLNMNASEKEAKEIMSHIQGNNVEALEKRYKELVKVDRSLSHIPTREEDASLLLDMEKKSDDS